MIKIIDNRKRPFRTLPPGTVFISDNSEGPSIKLHDGAHCSMYNTPYNAASFCGQFGLLKINEDLPVSIVDIVITIK